MSATVILLGTLLSIDIKHAEGSGDPYVSAKVRVDTGKGSFLAVVTAFGDAAYSFRNLNKGDPVSVKGKLEVNAWLSNGEAKAAARVFASEVMTMQSGGTAPRGQPQGRIGGPR